MTPPQSRLYLCWCRLLLELVRVVVQLLEQLYALVVQFVHPLAPPCVNASIMRAATCAISRWIDSLLLYSTCAAPVMFHPSHITPHRTRFGIASPHPNSNNRST